MRGLLIGAGAFLLGAYYRRGTAVVDESPRGPNDGRTVTGSRGTYLGASWAVSRSPEGGWAWVVEVPAATPGTDPVRISSDASVEAIELATDAALEAIRVACAEDATACGTSTEVEGNE